MPWKRAQPRKQPLKSPTKQATVRHVGSGKYSDVFEVKRGQTAVMMKISFYREDTLCNALKKLKKGDLRGAMQIKKMDSIQVSSSFARMTTGLMATVSPHFVLVYCDKDCSLAGRMGTLLKDRLKGLSDMQKKYNNVCFMEIFHDNMTKFLVVASYGEDSLRAMIFQVLYTLAALQKRLPGFRHNDLSTNNVLIKKLKTKPLLQYTLGAKTFYVANDILPALSDYDFTNVPGHPTLTNERVYSGKYKVDGRRNDSYDSHFFLKSVLKCIQRRVQEFPATAEFLKRLRMRTEDRQNNAVIPRLFPATLLNDAYFDPLRNPPSGRIMARYKA